LFFVVEIYVGLFVRVLLFFFPAFASLADPEKIPRNLKEVRGNTTQRGK